MIKQIQLRGISRTPSERLIADGGVAESLNVQLDQTEVAPVIVPEDADLGLPETGADGEVIFIHKQPGYTNAITCQPGEDSCTLVAYSDGVAIPMGEIGFTPRSVTSIGNTVILSGAPFQTGGDGSAYFLFKNGEYKFLGNEIPVPDIRFAPETMTTATYADWLAMTDEQKKQTAIGEADFRGEKARALGALPVLFGSSSDTQYTGEESEWTYRRVVDNGLFKFENWSYAPKYESNDEFWIKPIIAKLWEQINEVMHYNAIRGIMNMPIFVRYAVRMYDGSSYGVSIPILIAPWGDDGNITDDFVGVGMQSDVNNTTTGSFVPWAYSITAAYTFRLNYILKLLVADTAILDDWEDLVEGLDIFVSGMVSPYVDKTRFSLGTVSVTPNPDRQDYANAYNTDLHLDPWGLADAKEQEKNILSYDQFYLVKSYSIDELKELASGEWVSLQDDMNMSMDDLAVRENLKEEDAYQADHRMLSFDSSSYNKRMLVWNVAQRLGKGYEYPHASALSRYWSNGMRIWYHIDTGEGIERVVYGTSVSQLMWYSWIAYPDARCKKATIEIGTPGGQGQTYYRYVTIKMKSHPTLGISYAFFGLTGHMGDSRYFVSDVLRAPTEDNTEYITGQLIQSEDRNPWKFPAAGRITVGSGDIIDVAAVTTPLSEGQAGQYPLYVFTTEGVWALTGSDTGDLLKADAVSRDVAVSSDSVVPIEQSVIFVTAQGVMMLAGMNVTNLSPNMNGRHYVSTDEILEILDRNPDYLPYHDAYTADLPFLTFVSGCKIAFDYVGQRLIFFRSDLEYQYVYMLGAQTWHKMSVAGLGYRLVGTLNSYPDCFITALDKTTGKYFVKNMSVSYDPSKQQATLPGLIITRSLDLGEPDVRKAMKDLRIRGQFNRGDVKYILQGSFDGHHWKRLTSLRGGSYKLFRMIMIVDMTPTERISWVDVDYESRFTNRLR